MDSKPFEKRFALIIDADNVSAKYIKPITDELSKYGTITYKRIYGDWTSTLHAKWKDALLENSITPIQQFSYTTGKNATDSAMIIDAMDIMYTNSVEGFCIVSSDSDFTRLASRIRESGLTVIGMGEKKTPVPFRKACDIFTTLELLVGDSGKGANRRGHRGQAAQGAGQGSGPSVEQVERAVVDIVTDNQNNGKATGLGEVGSRLLKRYPDFDVRSYGTNQLTKLLGEFASVQVIKDGNSVMVELTESSLAVVDASQEEVAPSQDVPADNAMAEATSEQTERESLDAVSSEKPRRSRRSRSRRSRAKTANSEEAERPQAAQDTSDAQGAPLLTPSSSVEPSAQHIASSASEPEVGASDEAAETKSDVPTRPKRKRTARPRRVATDAEAAVANGGSEEPASTAKPRSKRPRNASGEQTPESLLFAAVREAGAEGVSVAVLTKKVRASFKTFKVRDHGYAQMRQYVASLGDIKVEKRGSEYFATLEE